ncbi:hypothetical protein [Vibrio sp. 10N.261.55.A7]|uniref:PKD domain-containing protein n=1 Tax=Vibrio sp. 10N.261.55.A7 TaxID=1880851 RepID=UPI000CAF6520|nr:hypothetical protein [Vibrio sp. 10N.261.55.A7]PMJ90728.1 hypothetical protein BCU12_11330 [Vibrio sp. 10N.261.55.A7]
MMNISNKWKNTLLALPLMVMMGCDSDDAITDTEKWTKPTVNAGSDQLHTLPQTSIALKGSAKSYPKNLYSIKTTKWTQISGPQQLAILNDSEVDATLMNPTVAGTYIFELYAKDSADRTNTDQVKIVLQDAAVMSMARSTAGYGDDYQATWDRVVDNYSSYDEIESQWQALYQPYLVEAENSANDEEWRQLVQALLEEVGDQRLLVSDLGQLQTAMAYRLNEHPQAITWKNSNGIGVVTFNDLSAVTIEQLNSELKDALQGLKHLDELWLEFDQPATVSEQIGLQLMAGLTRQPTQLYLNDLETEWLFLTSNVHLSQTIVKVTGVSDKTDGSDNTGDNGNTSGYDNRAITILADYLLNQEQGGQSFTFQPTFVVAELPLNK